MTGAGFNLDRVRLEAGQRLPAGCFDEFQRLAKTLVHGPAFQWLLVDAPDEGLRNKVIGALNPVLRAAKLHSSKLPLSRHISDVASLEERLTSQAKKSAVVHVLGAHDWFGAEGTRWDALNARRERLAKNARSRLVFWLDRETIEAAARHAPDLWAWRAGVYSFPPETEPTRAEFTPGPPLHSLTDSAEPDGRSMAERYRRIAEIRGWLSSNPSPPVELLVRAQDELGRLLVSVGQFDQALVHLREVELPLYLKLKDLRSYGVAMAKIANLLQTRGQLDEALQILRTEALPAFEKLKDTRARALALAQTTDILQARGRPDEALQILRSEVLPIFEQLGDVRSRAITLGKIADNQQARGQIEDALLIRRNEEIPTYIQIGDRRALAVTSLKLSDMLQARGQYDDALQILRNNVLPDLESLGDGHHRALAMARIADILNARGQHHEAERILRREVIPELERLGDIRSRAIASGRLAETLELQGRMNEALRIRREEELPAFEHLGDARGRSYSQGRIAELLPAQGELDEAVGLYAREVLPALERYGDIRGLALHRSKLASKLLMRNGPGDREEAARLLELALAGAEHLPLAQAAEIREIAQSAGLPEH